MTERVHIHDRLIFSLGTQVVALRDVIRQGGQVLHVSTSGDGVRWSTPSPGLLSGVYASTVLQVDGMYPLWFAKVNREPREICHASSLDGLAWSVAAEPVLKLDA